MAVLQPKFIDYYMRMAELNANMSSAVRLKVGTVVVRDHKILATGWNGTPSGWSNECEEKIWESDLDDCLDSAEFDERYPYTGWNEKLGCDARYGLKTKSITLHSEANAILKIARSTESSEGATLFCTHQPCLDCSKLIYQSGISSVYYRESYRESTGTEFLTASGVVVEQYNG